MAGYGYSNGGYTTYNWTGPRTNDLSKTSYAGDGHSDHVCRPVVVDAEGRKMPVSFSPAGSYVTKTEKIVEVRTPLITEYKYSSPAREEVQRENRSTNNKWARPLSPVHDRPQKVEEFITKIQTEVSQPTRPTGPLSTIYQHRTRPEFTPHHSTTGFGEYKDQNIDKDYSNKDWNKQSNNFARDRHFDDFYRPHAAITETTPITTSRAKPIQGTAISSATNDINKALEYLAETASKPSLVSITTAPIARPRFRVSVPRETINSREAERRYGNFNTSSAPFMNGSDGYRETIDGREATRRYNGAIV